MCIIARTSNCAAHTMNHSFSQNVIEAGPTMCGDAASDVSSKFCNFTYSYPAREYCTVVFIVGSESDTLFHDVLATKKVRPPHIQSMQSLPDGHSRSA